MLNARLASGQLFRPARIEWLGPGQDDDWLEFEFGPSDLAASAFRLPRSLDDPTFKMSDERSLR